MLVVSSTTREENRLHLAKGLRKARVVTGLFVDHSRLVVEAERWCDYWRPCRSYFEADTRLVHRLKHLKAAWTNLLQRPRDEYNQAVFCWRYFGLLHHTLRISKKEPRRGDPLPSLRKILGFEAFTVEVMGIPGKAGGAFSHRNPVALLGRIQQDSPPLTPRHIPLLLPSCSSEPYYYYRQATLGENGSRSLLLCPSLDLTERTQSFSHIDRILRLISERPDPYWRPRARLLSQRILMPLLKLHRKTDPIGKKSAPLKLLDLGAGTGHLVAKSWQYLSRQSRYSSRPTVSLHFVDASGPCFGRSFGISKRNKGISHIEWTTADYRKLTDDDEWLEKNGPFNWVFLCRLLGNTSNFFIEPVDITLDRELPHDHRCSPHWCLAPGRQPDGVRHLAMNTAFKEIPGGKIMPMFSLSEYFKAMQAVTSGNLDIIHSKTWSLPVRRFNPASLITRSGRSVIAQLLKIADAIIIEDVDLKPEHLLMHKQQYGLSQFAAVHFIKDRRVTDTNHYVVTSSTWADHLRGERLW